jgi:hypothetical protein
MLVSAATALVICSDCAVHLLSDPYFVGAVLLVLPQRK